VDNALLRPGRCYDICSFRFLTNEESVKFLKNFNLKIPLDKKSYSLAELYRIIKTKSTEHINNIIKENKIGFTE
jgi:ATP-dependent 26S proteasome regulatory subunit